MRALGILVLTACSSGPAATQPRPAPPPPPAPSEPARVADPCAADAARLQPSLDAHVALFDKWGFAPDAVERLELASASTELDRVPPKVPVVTMTPAQIELLGQAGSPTSIRSRLLSLGARDIVLAVESKTPWPAVVRLLHELPIGLRVHVAFAVASPAGIGDPAAVQRLRTGGGFRELGRDMAQRCPAVGDLFMAHTEDIVGVFARDAGAALRGCKCTVTATELANVYEALFVRGYIAGRAVKLARGGGSLGGGRSATFAEVARKLVALPADTEVWAEVDR